MADEKMVFERGEFVLRQDDAADAAFVVVEGEVAVFRRGDDGSVIPLAVVGPGQFLGELGVVANTTRTADALALSRVTVLRFSRLMLKKELARMSPWVSSLITGLAERLVRTDELVGRLGGRRANMDLLDRILPALAEGASRAGGTVPPNLATLPRPGS